MKSRSLLRAGTVALAVSVAWGGLAAAYELTIPSLVYRTGAYAPNGAPFANGYSDYFQLLNERDGGINGARINLIECETAYNTKQGVECYENHKNDGDSGAIVVQPLSTGITYQLIPKAAVDQVPIFSMGYGRTSAVNGAVFPWVFNFPATYWDQASVFVKYIAEQEGGLDQLADKKIALVHHNSAYGKEPIPTLQALSAKHGFEFLQLAVDHPGQEQKATWLQVRRERPDWVLLWGWGVMNQVAIKEASSIRYPMNRFIGNWWSGSEVDTRPSGAAADGYLSGGFHLTGTDSVVHEQILKLYDEGKIPHEGTREAVGEVLYNRGLAAALWTAEAIRTGMEIHGTNEVTGVHVRDGFEALDVDEARLAELGLEGFVPPVKISCANHAGPRQIAMMQWDAAADEWNVLTGFYDSDREVIDPLIAADSAAYAAENNLTPRDC